MRSWRGRRAQGMRRDMTTPPVLPPAPPVTAWQSTKRGLIIPAAQILGPDRVVAGLADVVEPSGIPVWPGRFSPGSGRSRILPEVLERHQIRLVLLT